MFFLRQTEKKQILRRLNQNLKAQSPVEEVESPPPSPAEPSNAPEENQASAEKHSTWSGDRKERDAAELPILPVTQQTFQEACATTNSKFNPHRTKA